MTVVVAGPLTEEGATSEARSGMPATVEVEVNDLSAPCGHDRGSKPGTVGARPSGGESTTYFRSQDV